MIAISVLAMIVDVVMLADVNIMEAGVDLSKDKVSS